MPRRAALWLLIALSLVTGGCGGHSDKSVSPLDDAVGYFSKDAPFVAAVETDPNGRQIKQVQELLGRFPGAEVFANRLRGLARFPFVDWQRDIRPQLGAPLVIGLAKPAAGRRDIGTAVVVA